MDIFQITKKASIPPKAKLAVFESGFRPFFILAGIYAVVLLFIWMGVYNGSWSFSTYYGLTGWHSHELLFGFTMAVVAGFLLTAVEHWTGQTTATKNQTILLVIIWLAGRIFPLTVSIHVMGAITDLLFLPMLGYCISKPIWKTRQKQNYVYPVLLIGLIVANVLIHLEKLGITSDSSLKGTYLAFNITILMIVIFGGRIFPIFTMGSTGSPVIQRKLINWIGDGSVVALTITQFLDLNINLILFIASVAAASNCFRMAGWYSHKIWKKPIVWILHVGFAWIVLGFAMIAINKFFTISPFLAVHALSAGGIGVSSLGMMVRVSLGHTGRLLEANRWIQGAFMLINFAAVVRVFFPIIWPESYTILIVFSSILWALAFLFFTITMMPILLKSRPDGKSG